MNLQRAASVLSAALGLATSGCGSHTGVVKIGQESYMIARQANSGFSGLGNMKAEIIAEGASYCAGLKRELQIVSTRETQPPYILGNYPRSEITFMCLVAGDPELLRPKLPTAPDRIIETR